MKARTTLITTLAAGIAALAPAMASASHYLPQGADSTATQQVRPDDRAGARGAIEFITRGAIGVRPDDRAGARGNTVLAPETAASTRPDDRAGYRGPSAPITASVAQVSNSFDWRDAFIGGVSGIGIALLLMGGLFLVTSRRTRAARIA